jgi:hypothetical protein
MAGKIVYLVMRADGNARVTTQRGVSRIGADEVAFRIIVSYPNGWGKIAPSTIELSMPQPPTITAIEGQSDDQPT